MSVCSAMLRGLVSLVAVFGSQDAWEERAAELTRQIEERAPEDDASALQFELALHLQDWADALLQGRDPSPETLDQRESLLDRAAALYRRVLTRQPRNTAASDNLALLLWDRGDRAAAADVLRAALDRSAVTEDPRAAERRASLGDLLMEQGEFAAAWREYAQAVDLRPEDALGRRLVDSCRALPGPERQPLLAGLRERAASLRSAGQWAAAAEAFALCLTEYAADDTRDADEIAEVFRDWVEVEALLQTFTRSRLQHWTALRDRALPAYTELVAVLENPGDRGRRSWWTDTALSHHVMTLALWSDGRQQARQGHPEPAVHALRAAFDSLMDYERYRQELRDREYPGTDIALSLAELYHGFQEKLGGFDDVEHLLADLEQMLWKGKNQGYRDRNKPVMQRYHTVLGLIYAEQGRFGRSLRDAPYHLTNALKLAKELDVEGHAFPLPELSLILANGLTGVEDARAAEHYQYAAQGFLLEHDLRGARQTLEAAHEYEVRFDQPLEWLPALDQVQRDAVWYQQASPEELIERAQRQLEGDTNTLPPDYAAGIRAGVPEDFFRQQEALLMAGAAQRLGQQAVTPEVQEAMDQYLDQGTKALQLEPATDVELRSGEELERRLERLRQKLGVEGEGGRLRKKGPMP